MALTLDAVSPLCCGGCGGGGGGSRGGEEGLGTDLSALVAWGVFSGRTLTEMLALLQVPVEPDGSRFSLPARGPDEESQEQESNQGHLTTPEK